MKKILFVLLLLVFGCGTDSRTPAGSSDDGRQPGSPDTENGDTITPKSEEQGDCSFMIQMPEGVLYVVCSNIDFMEKTIPLPLDIICGAPSCDVPECEPCECEEAECVEVCHIPFGHPENMHTICIEEEAVYPHLDHGDYLGPCKED